MRLYHHPMSSNARRALMTAIHLGLTLELAEVDLMNADDRRRLGELNPNAKLPVLADGAFLLWESCAIMQYLAEQAPGQTVYPSAPQARADVNRWLFWAAQHFSPAIAVLAWERAWKGMTGNGAADPLEEARDEHELHACAVVLDAHLARREWLCGEALSLADFAVAAPLMYSEAVRLPLAPYAHIEAWYARVRQLPAWQQTHVDLGAG